MSKKPRQQQPFMTPEEVIGMCASGIASVSIWRTLFKALRAKGILSDIEVIAILHAAGGSSAVRPGSEFGERMLVAMREHIRQIGGDLAEKIPVPDTQH